VNGATRGQALPREIAGQHFRSHLRPNTLDRNLACGKERRIVSEAGKVMRTVAGMSSSCGDRRRARRAVAFAASLILAAALVTPVHGQTASCRSGRIEFVFIDLQSIFDADDPGLDHRVQWAYRAANALHFRTRQGTVQRELLFAPGDCYDPFLLAESERLLRNFGTFANVDVFGVPQPDGNWHVIVSTRDEWSTQIDIRPRFDNGLEIEGARIFETNLLGTARRFGAFYYERDVTRDQGLFYATPHFFRTRMDAAVAVGKTRAGDFVRSEIAYPFVGEVGQRAGRLAYRRDIQFFDYISTDDETLAAPHVLFPVRDRFVDASFVQRFGERGRTLLLGGALSYEEMLFPGKIEVAPAGDFDNRIPADPVQQAEVEPQRNEREALRMSLLVGHQNIVWRKQRGFDTMRGDQDIRVGTEMGVIIGRTLSVGAGGHNLLFAGTSYAGFQSMGGFLVLRVRGDARWDLEEEETSARWRDVFLDGELLGYFRRNALSRNTLVLRAATSGEWNTTTPFQLTLGGERALRGYDPERFPGGRRVVFSVEDRIYLGWPWRDLFDTGLTLFADAGRIWPGDAPFGDDSGWRASAGLGIRSSFPAGGRTTYRIDFAWPIENGMRLSDVRVRFSVGEVLGIAQRDIEPQIARARPETIGGQLFDVRNR
jgi:hypothetical protein